MNWLFTHPIELFFILLLEYILLMQVNRLLEPHPGLWKIARYMLVPLFLVQDWILNFWLSIWFIDPPKGMEVVTGRLRRYKDEYAQMDRSVLTRLEKWRLWHAMSLCKVLNKYSTRGQHC